MDNMENGYIISDNKKSLDIDCICKMFSNTYWAKERPK